MQRSSETIGAIAAALAKAQVELTNPEKSLTARVASPFPREENKTFRYAPLSSGLEIVRKCLGRHEIAAVQTTAIDKESGLIRLTTTLAHSSGEWMSSEWPVCPVSETAAPHRLGAALTYARRHSLFTLVGIAGDDDTDAPSLGNGSQVAVQDNSAKTPSPLPARGTLNLRSSQAKNRPILSEMESAECGRRLVEEVGKLQSSEELSEWAQKSLPTKNILAPENAHQVEAAFAARAEALEIAFSEEGSASLPIAIGDAASLESPSAQEQRGKSRRLRKESRIDKSVLTFSEPKRLRDKAHLKFVASQPCLICGRKPSDAHHLRFAQLRALGRKVSDEFTVPLCRGHHRQVHQTGNEPAFWEDLDIDTLEIAKGLWEQSRGHSMAAS